VFNSLALPGQPNRTSGIEKIENAGYLVTPRVSKSYYGRGSPSLVETCLVQIAFLHQNSLNGRHEHFVASDVKCGIPPAEESAVSINIAPYEMVQQLVRDRWPRERKSLVGSDAVTSQVRHQCLRPNAYSTEPELTVIIAPYTVCTVNIIQEAHKVRFIANLQGYRQFIPQYVAVSSYEAEPISLWLRADGGEKGVINSASPLGFFLRTSPDGASLKQATDRCSAHAEVTSKSFARFTRHVTVANLKTLRRGKSWHM
jgi:hypothetical protein